MVMQIKLIVVVVNNNNSDLVRYEDIIDGNVFAVVDTLFLSFVAADVSWRKARLSVMKVSPQTTVPATYYCSGQALLFVCLVPVPVQHGGLVLRERLVAN